MSGSRGDRDLMTAPARANPVFRLPVLPYTIGSLAGAISSRTMQYHHGCHHAAHVDAATRLAAGREDLLGLDDAALLHRLGRHPEDAVLLHHVAQAWNHSFYWRSLSPERQRPQGELRLALERGFGSYAEFANEFALAGMSVFGSGWLWLTLRGDGSVRVVCDCGDSPPILLGATCLLVIDLWEHAYCLDYQNRRREYLDAVIDRRLNWRFAQSRIAAARTAP